MAGVMAETDDPESVFNKWLKNIYRALSPHSEALGEELVDTGLALKPLSEG